MTTVCNRLLGFTAAAGLGLALLQLMLPAPPAFSSDRVTLLLKTAVVVHEDAVRLADIADFSALGEKLQQQWGATVVARSPLPGQSRFVGMDAIRIRLKQAGIDPAAIAFQGPQDVRVTRGAMTLPVERIKQAVEAQIRGRMPWRNEDVIVDGITFDESIQLPTGELSFQILPNRNETFLGRTVLALHLLVNDQPVRRVWVNASVTVMADVVTVARPLGKNQPIEPAHLMVERHNRAELASDVVSSIEAALGHRTTRMIYPGTVLQSSMLALPPLVRRGDLVKIIAHSGPLTITATGLVRQQGGKGEMIRVVNTDSNRVITARVIGPGEVAVDF